RAGAVARHVGAAGDAGGDVPRGGADGGPRRARRGAGLTLVRGRGALDAGGARDARAGLADHVAAAVRAVGHGGVLVVADDLSGAAAHDALVAGVRRRRAAGVGRARRAAALVAVEVRAARLAVLDVAHRGAHGRAGGA